MEHWCRDCGQDIPHDEAKWQHREWAEWDVDHDMQDMVQSVAFALVPLCEHCSWAYPKDTIAQHEWENAKVFKITSHDGCGNTE